MTIQDAINQADRMKPNMMDRGLKIRALSELDGMIHREIILKHVHFPWQTMFKGYDEGTDEGQELLVPYPYAEDVYTYWLMARIDHQNMEMDKYNNDRALFENAYETFHDYWRRNHMPLTRIREYRL